MKWSNLDAGNDYVHRVSGGKRLKVNGLFGRSLSVTLSLVQRLVEQGLRSAAMSWDRLSLGLGVYPIDGPSVGVSGSRP